jgi:hypothetical protein
LNNSKIEEYQVFSVQNPNATPRPVVRSEEKSLLKASNPGNPDHLFAANVLDIGKENGRLIVKRGDTSNDDDMVTFSIAS